MDKYRTADRKAIEAEEYSHSANGKRVPKRDKGRVAAANMNKKRKKHGRRSGR